MEVVNSADTQQGPSTLTPFSEILRFTYHIVLSLGLPDLAKNKPQTGCPVKSELQIKKQFLV